MVPERQFMAQNDMSWFQQDSLRSDELLLGTQLMAENGSSWERQLKSIGLQVSKNRTED
jgi:hypothetical protein